MKISSLHCKNCTTTKTSSLLHSQRLQSNIEQLLNNCSNNSHSHNNNNDSSRHSTSHCDTNTSSSSPTSAESKSSISAHHYHHHNKPPPLLTTSHRSSRSSVNFQTSSHHPNHHHHPVSVRSSASSSDHQPYQPKHRISSSASSLTSPTLSSSSSSPPTSPSSPSSPFQPVPSASSVTTGEGLREEEKGEVMNPVGAIDSTTIAYYGELTLMSVQPHSASNQLSPVTSSVSVNISSSNLPETVAASASAATAANLTKEPEAVADHQAVTAPAAPDLSTNRQSYSSDASSSSVSSTTATKNLYSLQGDHFSGVNVTVEYVAAAEKQTPPIDERKDSSENCTLAITAAAGLATTTNTATMVLAQQQQNITASLPPPVPPQPGQANLISEAGDNNSNNNGSHRNSSPRSSSVRRSRNGSSSGKKCSSSKEGSKKAKHMKKSPSTISPNSDEIRNEALAIEREHSVGGGGGRCRSGSRNRPTCAMCGSLLSKSISQASTFSNVIVERPSDSGSVQTTASAQAALQGNRSLMSVPKHSTPLNSFSNLPVLYVSGKQSKQSASGQKKNHLQHLQQQQQNLSKASSWRSYSSFRFASKHYFGGGGGGSGGGSSGVFSSSRPRTDSIAVPANEFCEECACMASAVSAAARHRHALRREESSRLRQEKKAARQLGVILGAFIACWMPYIITYVVTAYCAHCVSLTVHQVTIWLGYLNSALNPCLYALCNENFKHAFKKMLGRATPPQHLSYNYDQQTIAGGGNTAASANGTTGGGSGSSKYMRASGGNAAGKGGGGGGGKMEPKLSLMKMCSVLLVFIK